MKTAAIILNFNSYRDTSKLLACIQKNFLFDIICVADNCSTSDDFEKLEKCIPKTQNYHLLKTQNNLGYAKGNNYCLDFLNEHYNDIDLFFVCNPDVIISNDCVNAIISFYRKHKFGICSVQRTDIKGNYTQRQTWEMPTIAQEIFRSSIIYRCLKKKQLIYCFDQNEKCVAVNVIPGSFFAFSKEAINNGVRFDPNTFLYYEENILGKILKEKKMEAYIITDVTYVHNHFVSSDFSIKKEMKMFCLYQRSSRYYFKTYLTKNHGLILLFKISLFYERIQHVIILLLRKAFKKGKKTI